MESNRPRSLNTIRFAAWTFLLAFIIFAFLYPLYTLLLKIKPADAEVLGLAWISVKQAFWSMLISMSVGLPFGIFLDRLKIAQRHRSLLLIPFSLPAMVTAQVALYFFDMSYGAVLFAHALLNIPWVAWIVVESLSQFPSTVSQAAKTLGVSRKQEITDFYIPYLIPHLNSAALQVFCVCLMSFTIVLLLGGGPPVQSLETEIFSSIRLTGFDLNRALSCAFLQFILVFIPTLIHWFYQQKNKVLWVSMGANSKETTNSLNGKLKDWLFVLCFVFPYAFIFLIDSALWDKLGWVKLFSKQPFWNALGHSLVLAFASASMVVSLALTAVLLCRPIAHFISLWSGVSALVLSIAFFMTYAQWLDLFEGSFVAMVVLQSIVTMPLAVRIFLPHDSKKQTHLLAVARSLGASEGQAWWSIEWPRWRGILISVFSIAWVFSLGETAAISLFASEKIQTLSLFTSQVISKYKFEESTRLLFILFVISVTFLKIGGHYEERK